MSGKPKLNASWGKTVECWEWSDPKNYNALALESHNEDRHFTMQPSLNIITANHMLLLVVAVVVVPI